MSAEYCHDCGTELSVGASFCSACGTAVDAEPGEPSEESTGSPETGRASTDEGSGSTFAIATSLILGAFVLQVLGITTAIGALVWLGVITWAGSIIAIYADLRELDDQLWDVPSGHWVILMVLFYVIFAPLYVYKRWQAYSG